MKLGFLNKTTGDLNEQDYLFADILPDGYTDITSITNIDAYWQLSNRDFKFARYQITLLRIATGYANLSDTEKVLANKWFASGVEYFNSEVTAYEQDDFFANFLKPGTDNSRVLRDLAVTKYLNRKLYTGVLQQNIIDQLVLDARGLRTAYLRDGTQGIGYSDTIEGVINFVKNNEGYSPFAIVGVNTSTKTFSVAGDKTSEFIADVLIRIHSATGNDGAYTVVSSSFDSTNTNIIVVEAISDSTADGDIYTKGFMWYADLTFEMQTEVFNIYWNGIY